MRFSETQKFLRFFLFFAENFFHHFLIQFVDFSIVFAYVALCNFMIRCVNEGHGHLLDACTAIVLGNRGPAVPERIGCEPIYLRTIAENCVPLIYGLIEVV